MRVITIFIAILSGFAVLGGYFLGGFFPVLKDIQAQILNAAITLMGVAALTGIFNLISVHTEKIRQGKKGGVYSALLIISLVLTFLLGIILRPEHIAMIAVMNSVIIPVEGALMGILTISLLYAAIRLLRRRVDVLSLSFLITTIIVLFTLSLPFGDPPLLGDIARWWSQIFALGGIRGILIGVALGSLTTGLRVLFGADRPYGGR